MTPLPPDLKDELQREYAATFDEKLEELETALKNKDQNKLSFIFHKLAGSGKTYEMDEISQLARKCEEILTDSFPVDEIKEAVHSLAKIFKQEKSRLNL